MDMEKAQFVAFARPYGLVTIICQGQAGEQPEQVGDRALAIIESLGASDEYKDLLRQSLFCWPCQYFVQQVLVSGQGW